MSGNYLDFKHLSAGKCSTSANGERAAAVCMSKDSARAAMLIGALKRCRDLKDLKTGKEIHRDVVEHGEFLYPSVANSLLDMYAKCGCMEGAYQVFQRMQRKTVVSWNCLIAGYVESGQGRVALEFYSQMQELKIKPTYVTILAALKACRVMAEKEEKQLVGGRYLKVESLQRGRKIHTQIAFSENLVVSNSLLDMYAKCGSMEDAMEVFKSMGNRDVVSWNCLILGYVQNGESSVAVTLYDRMQQDGCAPNHFTLFAVVKAYACLAEGREDMRFKCLDKVRELHNEAVRRGRIVGPLVTTLIDAYGKCGSVVEARRVFNEIEQPGAVSWNCIIKVYGCSQDMKEVEQAYELFMRMKAAGLAPDSRTYLAVLRACGKLAEAEEQPSTSRALEIGRMVHFEAAQHGITSEPRVGSTLVDMYARCGRLADAYEIFEDIEHRDVVAWNCLLTGFARNEAGETVLNLFECMQQEGCEPDSTSFLSALRAYSVLAENASNIGRQKYVEKGKAVHSQAVRAHEADMYVESLLVDLYAKCGNMNRAKEVFEGMQQRDVMAWNCLMLGYSSGDPQATLQLYSRMKSKGIAASSRTFVAVLRACGNLGALELGKQVHTEVCEAGNLLDEDAYLVSALISFYGKCGCLADAEKVFEATKAKSLPVWCSLLTAYSSQGDAQRVFELFERMQQEKVTPDDIVYLLVLTACSHAGLIDEAKSYFQSMVFKHRIVPRVEHYTCLVDMLGRANQLEDALKLVDSMPIKGNAVLWNSLLAAASKWNNSKVGKLAFEAAIRVGSKEASSYVLLSNALF